MRRAARLQAKPQPELHLLGEICGGSGFGAGVGVACKWALEAGERWELLEGFAGGQTQVDAGESGDTVVWSHPLDAHFLAGALQVRGGGGAGERGAALLRRGRGARARATWPPAPFSHACPALAHHTTQQQRHAPAAQGWPRLLFQAWSLDDLGRLQVAGYGFVHVPSAPGLHELSVPLWRPLGTPAQELEAYFLGGSDTLLTSTAVLFSAASERYRLVTAPSGTVHVRVEVLQRFVEVEAGM